MIKVKNYITQRYGIHSETITIKSILEDPTKAQYIRGNDTLTNKRRWVKFHSEEFFKSLYDEIHPNIYLISTWSHNNDQL